MATMTGKLAMGGELSARLIRAPKAHPAPAAWTLRNRMRWDFVKGLMGWWMAYLLTGLFGIPAMVATLRVELIRANGDRIDYGIVSYRVVTTAFVNSVVAQLQTETSVFGDFKYHDSGVGITDPAIGDTDIETTDGEARATGSQEQGASANIYKSIGTIPYTTVKAITEHGLFNASTGPTLMDRSEFAAINVVGGDSIQYTYNLSLTAGG
jgi:hypothetical protein